MTMHHNRKSQYPCRERMKLMYIVCICALISFLPVIGLIRKDLINSTNYTKLIIVYVALIAGITFLINIVQYYVDLFFLKKICFLTINKCPMPDVWRLIYNRGIRLHPVVMNHKETAFIVIKTLYEYGRQTNDSNVEEIAKNLLHEFNIKTKSNCSETVMNNSSVKIAKDTLDYLYSRRTLSLMIFYVINQPKLQKVMFYTCILIFICFMIMQMVKIFL